jgi:hypothetical protein
VQFVEPSSTANEDPVPPRNAGRDYDFMTATSLYACMICGLFQEGARLEKETVQNKGREANLTSDKSHPAGKLSCPPYMPAELRSVRPENVAQEWLPRFSVQPAEISVQDDRLRRGSVPVVRVGRRGMGTEPAIIESAHAGPPAPRPAGAGAHAGETSSSSDISRVSAPVAFSPQSLRQKSA